MTNQDKQDIINIINSMTTEYHISGSPIAWIPREVLIEKIKLMKEEG